MAMSMTLREFLDTENVPHGQFAARIGVSAEAVRRYLQGKRRPSWDVMPKIIEATGGKVTPDSFLASDQSRQMAREVA